MKGNCKYIFQKGKRKGLTCSETCLKNKLFCGKHTSHEPKPTIEIKLEDPLKTKILNLQTTYENKAVILKHYFNMKRLDPSSTEHYKNQMFVDMSLTYPWNKSFTIHDILKTTNTKSFINYIQTTFDTYIYGMDNVKKEIINLVCKFITNPESKRNNIALCGPAGVGKSKFIHALSETLGLPMKTISLGGIKDSSFFLGHGYVYVESGPGKIIQNIIDSKISNPILHFDELDKVSETDNGKDIYSFLTYLTDPSQNMAFTDHYFYGMKFDLSKVFFVFTFNDINKIDKILLDRLNIVNVDMPTKFDICNILYKHCIPEIIDNIRITKTIRFDKHVLSQIVQTPTQSTSSGIRHYYRIIEKILLELNKDILLDTFNDDSINIDENMFNTYLSKIKSQIVNETTHLHHMYM